MNPIVGWTLAVVALVAGWRSYGWPGIVLAFSVIVFWLLIQFNRSVKVMRNAAGSPIGHVDSAVMLNAKLSAGLPMIRIVTLTRSLGRRVAEEPETWTWADASGSAVTVVFHKGRCVSWALTRPEA
jgi:uncharacterized protein (DUF58 family)